VLKYGFISMASQRKAVIGEELNPLWLVSAFIPSRIGLRLVQPINFLFELKSATAYKTRL
jgi:hypothetical protein